MYNKNHGTTAMNHHINLKHFAILNKYNTQFTILLPRELMFNEVLRRGRSYL